MFEIIEVNKIFSMEIRIQNSMDLSFQKTVTTNTFFIYIFYSLKNFSNKYYVKSKMINGTK